MSNRFPMNAKSLHVSSVLGARGWGPSDREPARGLEAQPVLASRSYLPRRVSGGVGMRWL